MHKIHKDRTGMHTPEDIAQECDAVNRHTETFHRQYKVIGPRWAKAAIIAWDWSPCPYPTSKPVRHYCQGRGGRSSARSVDSSSFFLVLVFLSGKTPGHSTAKSTERQWPDKEARGSDQCPESSTCAGFDTHTHSHPLFFFLFLLATHKLRYVHHP